MAMERALGLLADAERALEDCSSCLARDVMVSEAEAAEHNRSVMCARDALLASRRQIRREHEEVCRHLEDAQLRFLQSKPLIALATGTQVMKLLRKESWTFRLWPSYQANQIVLGRMVGLLLLLMHS